MSEPVLQLVGVARDFSDGRVVRRVLKETTLDILPGEMTVLAGPSGSGKTTLLTIMGLVLKPSTGRIVVGGKDVTGFSEDRLASIRQQRYGFVFQQAALVPAPARPEHHAQFRVGLANRHASPHHWRTEENYSGE